MKGGTVPEPTDTKSELIKAAIGIATTIITYYLARKMMQPDFTRNLHMKSALTVKRVAQRNADAWQHIADNAATAYQNART
jgi:hypothetical protein